MGIDAKDEKHRKSVTRIEEIYSECVEIRCWHGCVLSPVLFNIRCLNGTHAKSSENAKLAPSTSYKEATLSHLQVAVIDKNDQIRKIAVERFLRQHLKRELKRLSSLPVLTQPAYQEFGLGHALVN